MAPFVGDFDPLDPHNASSKRRLSTRTIVLAACVGVLIVLGIAWFLHDRGPIEGPLPVIHAPEGTHKVYPQEPDTSVVPHQDKKVYERIQGESIAPTPAPGSHTLTPEILHGQPDASGQRIVNRETPIPVKEGLRVYSPPPPGLPGLEEESIEPAGADEDTDAIESESDEEEASEEEEGTESKNDEEDSEEEGLEDIQEDKDEEDSSPASQSKAPASSPSPKASRAQAQSNPISSQAESPKVKYRLQIASATTRERAQAEWNRLRKAHPKTLKNLNHQISSVDLGANKGVRYRVYVGGWPTYKAAQATRNQLNTQGLEAIIVQP